MNLRRSRSAAGMVEYSLIAALVALALIVILALVGTGVTNVFQQVINGLTGNTPVPTNSLVVNITKLYISTPGDLGVAPSVLVTGPGGYSQALTASTTLNNLGAGAYTVTGNPVVATPAQSPVPVTFWPTVTPTGPSAGVSAFISIPSTNHTAIVDYTNAIPASSHAVTGADLAKLATLTGDATNGYTITFSSQLSFAPLVVGDVLAFDPSALTPSALMVKIVTVANGGLTITASQATFSDLFTRLSLTTPTSFTGPAYATSPLISSTGAAPHASTFSLGCGTGPQLPSMSVTGSGTQLLFTPDWSISPPWPGQDHSRDHFGLTVGISDIRHVAIDSNTDLNLFCQVSFPALFTIYAPLIPIAVIGIIPIWMDPTLKLVGTLNFTIAPNGHHPWYTDDIDLSASVGFLCDNHGCTSSHNLSFNGANGINLTAKVDSMTIKLGPRVDLKFEGIFGPYFAAYAYLRWISVPNVNPSCFNGELGVAVSMGLALGFPGPFGSLWNYQVAEVPFPFSCLYPIAPNYAGTNFAPSNPSLEPGVIDNRGCANAGCISTDGYNTPGNVTGPGQIQLNPDNSLPRYTREQELSATFSFPATFTPSVDSNLYGPGCYHYTATTDCRFSVAVRGRTFNQGGALNGPVFNGINGGIYGAWDVIDGNGWVYTPTNAVSCPGDNNGLHPCNDMILFGGGNHGYVGPGAAESAGCGGNECVAGGQLTLQCMTASGVPDTCAGHTLIFHIWIESGGKADYTLGGSQNWPEQALGWFDGVTVWADHTRGGQGNYFVYSSAASGDWHCSPAGDNNNTLYNSPCPG